MWTRAHLQRGEHRGGEQRPTAGLPRRGNSNSKNPRGSEASCALSSKKRSLCLPKLRSLDGKKKSKRGQPSEHCEAAWVRAGGSWCVFLLTLKTGHHVSTPGCLFIPRPYSGHNHPSSADEETEVITVQILLLYHFYCYTRFQDHRHLLSRCGRVRGSWSPKDSSASGAGAGGRSRRKQGGGRGEDGE